jgi:hypothetical protein
MNIIKHIVVKVCFSNIDASERLMELILTHIERHRECTNMYIVLMRVMEVCPYLKEYAVHAELASVLVEILESICGEPELPPIPVQQTTKLSQRRGSEVAIPTSFVSTPMVPAEYRTTLNKS